MPNSSINLNCVECRRFIGHPTTLSDIYSPIACPACKVVLRFTDGGWVRKKVSLEKIIDCPVAREDLERGDFVIKGDFDGR